MAESGLCERKIPDAYSSAHLLKDSMWHRLELEHCGSLAHEDRVAKGGPVLSDDKACAAEGCHLPAWGEGLWRDNRKAFANRRPKRVGHFVLVCDIPFCRARRGGTTRVAKPLVGPGGVITRHGGGFALVSS
jgi:hypothetical protein